MSQNIGPFYESPIYLVELRPRRSSLGARGERRAPLRAAREQTTSPLWSGRSWPSFATLSTQDVSDCGGYIAEVQFGRCDSLASRCTGKGNVRLLGERYLAVSSYRPVDGLFECIDCLCYTANPPAAAGLGAFRSCWKGRTQLPGPCELIGRITSRRPPGSAALQLPNLSADSCCHTKKPNSCLQAALPRLLIAG